MRSSLAPFIGPSALRPGEADELGARSLHEREIAIIPLRSVQDPARRAIIREEAERLYGRRAVSRGT